jgi:hypothetical protein
MKNLSYLILQTAFLLFVYSSQPLLAMDKVNDQIAKKLEQLKDNTKTLTEEEVIKLEELILALQFSNKSLMSEEDRRIFKRGFTAALRGTDEDRKNYLSHLCPVLDENDDFHIEMKTDIMEKLWNFYNIFLPAGVVTIELLYYDSLLQAWERGSDGFELMQRMFQIPMLALIMRFPRNWFDSCVSRLGLLAIAYDTKL